MKLPGIAPEEDEECMTGWTGKTPKSQYGLVKLKISNCRKFSAFKANKLFANKTLRAGRKIRVLQSKPMAWKLFFRDACVTLCKKRYSQSF